MAETIISKRCSHCKQIKSLEEFPRNKKSKDGRHNQCKQCHNEACRRYAKSDKGRACYQRQLENPMQKIRVRRYLDTEQGKATKHKCFRRYIQSDKGKAYRKIADRRRAKRYPLKFRARLAISHAIERGEMKSASLYPCLHCEQQAKLWHHHKGYEPEHWLDVIPLCPDCDRLAHKST